MLILSPIFEADLQPEQYAYRQGRNAHDAVRHIHRLLNTGYRDVVDADLADYFGSIPHAELMSSVARRVSDRHMLHLIKQWIVAPVEEEDGRGGKRRTAEARHKKRGIPQGAPISPLLSNIYMRRFLLGWKVLGHAARLNARIVNYADDLTILCRGTAEEAMNAMREIMGRLKLTVNEEKTRLCRVPDSSFNFLGYNFGRCYSTKSGRAYIGTRPAKKSIAKVRRTISELTSRTRLPIELGAASGATQSASYRLGQLLLSGSGQQGIPGSRCACGRAAAPVVVQEAQDARSRNCTVPGRAPLSKAGAQASGADYAQPSVGESVMSCPSAVCGRSARTVR